MQMRTHSRRCLSFVPFLESLEERATPAGLQLPSLLASPPIVVGDVMSHSLPHVQLTLGDVSASVGKTHGGSGPFVKLDLGTVPVLNIHLDLAVGPKGIQVDPSVAGIPLPNVSTDPTILDLGGGDIGGTGVQVPSTPGKSPLPVVTGTVPPTTTGTLPTGTLPTGTTGTPAHDVVAALPGTTSPTATQPSNVPLGAGAGTTVPTLVDAGFFSTVSAALRGGTDTLPPVNPTPMPPNAVPTANGNANALGAGATTETAQPAPMPGGTEDDQEDGEFWLPEAESGSPVMETAWTSGNATTTLDRLFADLTDSGAWTPSALAWKLTPALFLLTALAIERRRSRSTEKDAPAIPEDALGFMIP